MYVRAGVVCVVVCVVDEHTDVDDGRRLIISVSLLSAAGHARRISRRVGVWVVGKRNKRSVVGCLKKRGKRFYLPWMEVSSSTTKLLGRKKRGLFPGSDAGLSDKTCHTKHISTRIYRIIHCTFTHITQPHVWPQHISHITQTQTRRETRASLSSDVTCRCDHRKPLLHHGIA